jgi:hypothetical protein
VGGRPPGLPLLERRAHEGVCRARTIEPLSPVASVNDVRLAHGAPGEGVVEMKVAVLVRSCLRARNCINSPR